MLVSRKCIFLGMPWTISGVIVGLVVALLLEAISFVTGDGGGGSVAGGESKECVYCGEKCSLAMGHPCFLGFLPMTQRIGRGEILTSS